MRMFRRVSLVIVVLLLVGCASSPKYIRVPEGECMVLLTKSDTVLSVGKSCVMERTYTQ